MVGQYIMMRVITESIRVNEFLKISNIHFSSHSRSGEGFFIVKRIQSVTLRAIIYM